MKLSKDKQIVLQFLQKNVLATISTVNNETLKPESALIAFAERETLEILFVTREGSRKYKNLLLNKHVALVIGWDTDPQNWRTLQYEGDAWELSKEEYPFWREIFAKKKDTPCTSEFLLHPKMRFFKISPTWIGFSDFSQKNPRVIEIEMNSYKPHTFNLYNVGMRKNTPLQLALVVIGLFSVAVIVGFLMLSKKNNPSSPSYSAGEEAVVVVTPSPVVHATPDTSALLAGGSSYRDTNGVYVFLYPNDYTLDGDDTHKRISKRGGQQRPQSEMTNGVLMDFESVALKGKTLESWTDDRITEATGQGASELIEAKKAVTIHGYSGFTYETRGLGTAVSLVLQKSTDSQNAVNITYSVSDPESKNYQSEVDAILSTLELLK